MSSGLHHRSIAARCRAAALAPRVSVALTCGAALLVVLFSPRALAQNCSTPPVIELPPHYSAYAGDEIEFHYTACYDPDQGDQVVEYFWGFSDAALDIPDVYDGPVAWHTFLYPGRHKVELWVRDTCDNWSGASSFIDVELAPGPCDNNRLPVAVISGPTEGRVGDSFTFSSAGSYDADGADDITGRTWNVGEQWGSGVEFTPEFTDPGTYVINLQLHDHCERSEITTWSVTVHDSCYGNNRPVAIGSGPTEGLGGQTLTFSGSGSYDSDPDDRAGGVITRYTWLLDGLTLGDGVSISHQFAMPPTYAPVVHELTLYVWDDCMWSNPYTHLVTIHHPCEGNQPPVARIVGPTTGERGAQLFFDGRTSSDPQQEQTAQLTYRWYLNGGNTPVGTASTYSYAFQTAGTYTLRLVATDPCGGAGETTHSVQITEPAPPPEFNPALLGSVPGLGAAFGIALSADGNTAFVASLDEGLLVVDVSDPANMAIIANARDAGLTFSAEAAAVQGDLVLLGGYGSSYSELFRWNASTETLTHLSTVPSGADNVALRGTRAYCCAASFGVRIYDITNPGSPALLNTVAVNALDIAFSANGRYAYVASGSSGLKAVDLQASPPQVVNTISAGTCYSVATNATGTHLAVGKQQGTDVYSLSNAALPAFVSATTGTELGYRVRWATDVVAVCTSSSIVVHDAANPSSPQRMEVIADTAGDAAFAGGRLVAALSVNGIRAYVESAGQLDPLAPAFTTRGVRTTVTTDGNRAVVGGSQGDLSIVDIADPAAPLVLGRIAVSALSVATVGNALLVGGGTNVKTYSLADPTNPQLVTTLPFVGRDIALRGDNAYAFVAANGSGLKVLGLANPTSPTVDGSLTLTGNCRGIACDDSRHALFIAAGTTGMHVVDVTNPTAPVRLATLSGMGNTMGAVRVSAQHVLVWNASTIFVVNVSNLTSPQLGNQYAIAASDVTAQDGVVLCARALSGVEAYLFESGQLAALGAFPQIGGSDDSVAIFGDTVVTGNSTHPLVAYDLDASN